MRKLEKLIVGGVRRAHKQYVKITNVLIQMLWNDHAPPHFHALYAEYEALIDIRTLEIIEGGLPRRAIALVLEWAQEHRGELLEDWDLCSQNQHPKKILPLP